MDARRRLASSATFSFACLLASPLFQIFIRSGSELLILLDLGIRLDQIFLGPLEITNKLQAWVFQDLVFLFRLGQGILLLLQVGFGRSQALLEVSHFLLCFR